MSRTRVAVVMGGFSREYDISLKSGQVVLKHLPANKYQAFGIIISKEGWFEYQSKSSVNREDFSVVVNAEKVTFDVVFNAIHGTPGEDGLLQAYFELLGIPHTSCGFYQAALTFNKRDLLSALKPYGIPSAPSFFINKGDVIDVNAVVARVGLPCFVKANRSGSSFGVYKVNKMDDLLPSISLALEVDEAVLIEKALTGREVSVGVIQYKGETFVLPITEIISENEFFDYDAKYLGKSREITPADLSSEWTTRVSTMAKKIYEVLGMKGFSRSEFILYENEPHLLEVNTVPGLTEQSLLPQQSQAAGIELPVLFDNAIQEALHDFARH